MSEICATELERASSMSPIQVEVLSTFVADPVLTMLHYWFNEFNYEAEFLPTSDGQLFQRLLGEVARFNNRDLHVVLFAVRDLVTEDERGGLENETPHANIVEFVKALKTAVATSAGIWIVVCCPDPPVNSAAVIGEIGRQAEYIAAQAAELPRTIYLDTANLAALYGIDTCFDGVSDRHAHIPYTDTYYAAIATSIFRTIRSRMGQLYKLIVTDCDGTLWDGICGEVTSDELVILPHHAWLHAFLQRQKSAGTLVAICSQNSAGDVERVFAQREDLGLLLSDFTAVRINWNDKAENIKDLARELNIALNSVIFLDDDPLQRNKVQAALPQVLVPELPAMPDEWRSYLEHVWAFDSFGVTGEASRRSSFYREHAIRESVRSRSAGLSQFLRELELQISIESATENEISRIFELVNRVTQFNVNEIHPNESEILELMSDERGEWLVVRVKDRFGDYGLVGAVSCKYESGHCAIGSFLLSCRALGRGVEHQMLQAVGKRTLNHQINQIRFAVAETGRNLPAIDFLKRFGMSAPDLSTGSFRLEASSAARKLDEESLPGRRFSSESINTAAKGTATEASVMTNASRGEVKPLLAATISVQDLDALTRKARMTGEREKKDGSRSSFESRNEIEEKIVAIFQGLLGQEHIGLDEEFFDVGGHSLLVMRLLSQIRDVFGVDLPMRMLFIERLTIANLASIVATTSTPEENSAELATIKNALDTFSDEEIAGLFGDLGESTPASDVSTTPRHDIKTDG